MELKNIFNAWKEVFSNWKYVVLTFFIALSFYSLNVAIGNWKIIPAFYSSTGLLETIKFFLILLWGFWSTVKFHSYVSLIIISILFGLLFSLISYRTSTLKTKNRKIGVFASIGIFIGILAPGCAACGVGLLSLFGISAAFLTFLPFEGLELSILSIGILSFSVLKISESIEKGDVCSIKFTKMKGGFNK